MSRKANRVPIQTNAKIPQVADFGQQIGVDYWRQTPHVWSSQGTGKPCGLCLLSEGFSLLHLLAEPYLPQPTFTAVNWPSGYSGPFTGELSCGHGPIGIGGLRRRPEIGDSYDCMTCRIEVDERNQPGLPDEVREHIEAQLPKCPTCAGPIDTIPFIKRTVHKYQADVDPQTGEILASSEHHDTLEEVPDYGYDGRLEVTCENGHSWFEDRLKYQYDYTRSEHVWYVAAVSVEVVQP